MDGIESWRIFPPPFGISTFRAPGVDTSVAPTPREAAQETSPILLLPLPQTSLRLFPELRHWPWLTDRLLGGSPAYTREHTNPKSAKSVQPSPSRIAFVSGPAD